MDDTLTLVIDIGKSHAKLLLVDAAGAVVDRHGRGNASVASPLGYPALDVQGLECWMAQTLRSSAHARRCRRAMVSTHGAAFVGLDEAGLAWAPLDYEFAALDAHSVLAHAFDAEADDFSCTGSPPLPMGLNAARQLAYVQAIHPQAWARTRTLLPYPQYWAWVLCGQRASEVSSLGCHTHLWLAQTGTFSNQARRRGWAVRFAQLHHAWEVLGTVRPEVAQAWGLHPQCEVHVGVHDSNACLARYLDSAVAPECALSVVSSGTWTVLMAPGAPTLGLQSQRDMLVNVDVLGRATPTARFMGGREYAALLDGAAPGLGTAVDVQTLIDDSILAVPAFAEQGGPFRGSTGQVRSPRALSPGERSALAAVYCAQMTAWLMEQLWQDVPRQRVLVVEGPLAHNALYLGVLQSLLPQCLCWASLDALEGTARGAWMLAHWGQGVEPLLERVQTLDLRWGDYHAQWLAALPMAV